MLPTHVPFSSYDEIYVDRRRHWHRNSFGQKETTVFYYRTVTRLVRHISLLKCDSSAVSYTVRGSGVQTESSRTYWLRLDGWLLYNTEGDYQRTAACSALYTESRNTPRTGQFHLLMGIYCARTRRNRRCNRLVFLPSPNLIFFGFSFVTARQFLIKNRSSSPQNFLVGTRRS